MLSNLVDTPVLARRGGVFATSIGIRIVPIQAGEFRMGTTPEQVELIRRRYSSPKREGLAHEQPQHRVRVTKPLAVSAHEVTVGQFRRFVQETAYKTDAE